MKTLFPYTSTGGSGGGGVYYFTPEAYGAIGNGTADDTVAIQAAITAAQAVGGVVQFGLKTYKITDTLTITTHCTLAGVNSNLLSGSLTASSGESINLPGISPYIQGTVLNMVTAAKNAINITAVGQTVNIRDIGILFGAADLDGVRFANTGHGIYCHPTGTYTTGGHDYGENGIQCSRWKNVLVYGVDGTHYGIHLCNSLYNVFENLYLVGGGAFQFENNSFSYCGNMTINGGWFWMVVEGTSHGIHLKNTSFANSGTGPDHMVFLNCQVLPQQITDVPGPGYGMDTQRLIKIEDGAQFLAFYGCSFESVGFNCRVEFPPYIIGLFIDAMSTVQSSNQWTRQTFADGSVSGASPVIINNNISFGKGTQAMPSYMLIKLFDYPVTDYGNANSYCAALGFDAHSITYATQTGDNQAKHRFGSLATDGTTFTDWFTVGPGAGVVKIVGGLPTADPHVAGQLWSNSGIVTISSG